MRRWWRATAPRRPSRWDVKKEKEKKTPQTFLGLNVKGPLRGNSIVPCIQCGENMHAHEEVVQTHRGIMHDKCFEENQEGLRGTEQGTEKTNGSEAEREPPYRAYAKWRDNKWYSATVMAMRPQSSRFQIVWDGVRGNKIQTDEGQEMQGPFGLRLG